MTDLIQSYTLAVLATLAAWQAYEARRLRKEVDALAADLSRLARACERVFSHLGGKP